MLARAQREVATAAIEHLQELAEAHVNPSPVIIPEAVAERERLYYILPRLPLSGAVHTLKDWAERSPNIDGDLDRPIGAALAEALERCETAST